MLRSGCRTAGFDRRRTQARGWKRAQRLTAGSAVEAPSAAAAEAAIRLCAPPRSASSDAAPRLARRSAAHPCVVQEPARWDLGNSDALAIARELDTSMCDAMNRKESRRSQHRWGGLHVYIVVYNHRSLHASSLNAIHRPPVTQSLGICSTALLRNPYTCTQSKCYTPQEPPPVSYATCRCAPPLAVHTHHAPWLQARDEERWWRLTGRRLRQHGPGGLCHRGCRAAHMQ